MKYIFSFILCLIFFGQVFSQEKFVKVFYEPGNPYYFKDLVLTGQREYAFASDHSLVKIDSIGSIIWANNLASSDTNHKIRLYSLLALADGGLLCAGTTEDLTTNKLDILVIRTNENGQISWAKNYHIFPYEKLYKILPLRDGGFCIAGGGDDQSVIWDFSFIINIDSIGNIRQLKVYHGTGLGTEIRDIIINHDNGFCMLIDNRYFNSIVLKVDSLGEVLAADTFSANIFGLALMETPDNSTYIIGNYPDAYSNFCILKFDSAWNLLWTKSKVIDSPQLLQPYRIFLASDGNLRIMSGYENTGSSTLQDIYVSSMDTSGHFLWTKKLPGKTGFGGVLFETGDKGLVTISNYQYPGLNSKVLVIKTDSLGNTNCGDSSASWIEEPDSMELIPIEVYDTLFFATVTNESIVLSGNIITEDFCTSLSIGGVQNSTSIKLFPNPVFQNATVQINGSAESHSLKIFNSIGIEVRHDRFYGDHYFFNRENLSSGIYLIQIIDENESVAGCKMILE